MNKDNGFIIEFIAMGNSVKVTCIDPRTGREVSTIGPANAPRSKLSNAAVRKMQYVINKEQS
ncbi:hypothetical protein N8742_01570 [Emcibacteraceae bacterium]|nr:hypothetical protein [Emcibacteraceae bacterium]MDA9553567.1 hypothetical protein [Emcibacteraceae bacterium]